MRGKVFLHFVKYHLGLEQAMSDTSLVERDAIGKYASGKKSLVELGVYQGVSSRIIRKSMSSDGVLYCVDPFFPDKVGVSYNKTIFKKEIARSTNGRYIVVKGLSHDCVLSWNTEIDFLFIDADHAYEKVKRDWTDWSKFIGRGGVVAFHDSVPVNGRKPSMGSVVFVGELIRNPSPFTLIDRVETLTVFRRD